MAVEAVLVVIAKRLATLLIHNRNLLEGLYDQVESIERELMQLQGFLRDAEERQEEDVRIKKWFMDVLDVAYHLEEAIDICLYTKAQQKRKGLVKRYVSAIFSEFFIHYQFNAEIGKIKAKLQDVVNRQAVIGIKINGEKSETFSSGFEKCGKNFHPNVDQVGLEENVKLLEAHLIGGHPQRSVITIVGPSGIGKTSLVQKVFHSETVKNHFHGQAWLHVSHFDDDRRILHELARSLSLTSPKLRSLDTEKLLIAFNDVFKNDKLLIVVDDVSSINVWETLELALPDAETGARVVLITRDDYIASHADPSGFTFNLQPLNEDDTWKLFSQKINGSSNWESSGLSTLQLERLKKQVTEICARVPLAITLLGSLMSWKGLDFVDHLSKRCKPINLSMDHTHFQLTQILNLCYDDMPFLLKLCFIYIGVFPRNAPLTARRLVQLWISEGFVWDQGAEFAEDIAERYLEELADRGMLRVVQRRRNGSIKICHMLPIMREFSILKAKEVQLFDYYSPADSSNFYSLMSMGCLHRVSVLVDVDGIPLENYDRSYLHSFMYFGVVQYGDQSTILSGNLLCAKVFRMLRVLDLGHIFLPRLPKEVGDLIHLRYLGLRNSGADVDPSCICSLENLQTLDLKGTKTQNRFPHDVIAAMQHLRHLYIDAYYTSDTFFPPRHRLQVLNPPLWNVSYSPRIQTLWRLGIDKHSHVKHGWDRCTNLRKLGLTGDFTSQAEPVASWISKLHHLEYLRLENTNLNDYKRPTMKLILFSSRWKYDHINLRKLVLISFWIEQLPSLEDFPPYLSDIYLGACKLEEDPLPTLAKLPKLESLVLSACVWPQMQKLVCHANEFPQLTYLRLNYLQDLEKWTIEEGAFPSLRKLSLSQCDKLKMIPEGLHHVTSLKKLDIIDMPSQFKARVEEDTGEDWNKVPGTTHIVTKIAILPYRPTPPEIYQGNCDISYLVRINMYEGMDLILMDPM